MRTLVIALVCIVAGATSGAAQHCAPTAGHEVVRLMNQVRDSEGLPHLKVDARLVQAAQGHADDLAARDRLGHDGTDGSEPSLRATRAGYPWTFIAENVAAGYPTPRDVVEGWLRSRSHRENMLSPEAVHVGIGYVRRRGGRFDSFWAASFGATPDVRVAPPNDCHP